MSSTYSPSLRIELIGAGEQAGTWNTTTNTNLGTLVETAIAGNVTISIDSANQALTANNGAYDQARQAVLTLTTTTGANFAVYAPPQPKEYVINNTTAYNAIIYNSTVLGNTTAAGAGVTIPPGKRVAIFSDASNFYALDAISLPTPGVLAVANGGTGVTTSTGAGNVVLSNSPALTAPNLGTPTVLVGTNISGTAANLSIGGTAANAISTQTATNATTATQLTTGLGWNISQNGSALFYNYNNVKKNEFSPDGSLALGGGNADLLCRSAMMNELNVYTRSSIPSMYGNYIYINTATFVPGTAGAVNIVWNAASQQGIVLKADSGTFNGNPIIFVNSANSVSGVIVQATNTVTYATSSDYRLKNSIAPMVGALDKVALLKPCTYKWNVDDSYGQGFIAHELQEVVSECVIGEKDAVNEDNSIKSQVIDTSFLVATLTAAIQELKAIVDTQAARITALES